ncbi:MAG: hypothetical protein DHS20C18_18520 [Saprospiraceae bacterium]|nr:MAG: hypothetical protein DHS20C18_18520 [Saprospiraceae bacterium]
MKFSRRNLLKVLSLSGAGTMLSFQLPPECLTTNDIEGPFYRPGAPLLPQLAPQGAPGTVLFITGTVYANDCQTPIINALVDVWHANDGGGYENDHYRGKVTTDESGQYSFQTVLPGKYLNGSQFRPRHLHYKISSEDTLLTTQIYFTGDTSIPIDPWASSPDAAERIITLSPDDNDYLHGVADITLDIDPVIIDGVKDGQGSINKPHIRHLYPNPMRENGQVEIALPTSGKVDLEVFDLRGRLINSWVKEKMNAGFHQVQIDTNNTLGFKIPSGIYILKLNLDGAAVDAKRWMVV